MTTFRNFVDAAHSHRAAAQIAAASGLHVLRPFSHAYLRVLAFECAAKALLLKTMKATDVADLKRKNEKAWKSMFTDSGGHDMRKLEKAVDLRNKMTLAQKTFPTDPDWHRLAGNGGAPATDRPYSLRYGADAVSPSEAAAEAVHLDTFVDVMLTSATSKR